MSVNSNVRLLISASFANLPGFNGIGSIGCQVRSLNKKGHSALWTLRPFYLANAAGQNFQPKVTFKPWSFSPLPSWPE